MIPVKGINGSQPTITIEKPIYINNNVPVPVEILKGFQLDYLDPSILTGANYPGPHLKRLTTSSTHYILNQRTSLIISDNTLVTTAGSFVLFIDPDLTAGTATVTINQIDYGTLTLSSFFTDTIALSNTTPTARSASSIFIQPNWLIVAFTVSGNDVYILVYDISVPAFRNGFIVNYPPPVSGLNNLWLSKSEDLTQILMQAGNDLWFFSFDSTTGTLTYVTNIRGVAESGATFAPNGATVPPYTIYVLVENGYYTYDYDPTIGTLTQTGAVEGVHTSYRYINTPSGVITLTSYEPSSQIPNFSSFLYDDTTGTKVIYTPKEFEVTSRNFMGDYGTSIVKSVPLVGATHKYYLYVARSGYIYIPQGYFGLVASIEMEYIRIYWRTGNYTTLEGGWNEVTAYDLNVLREVKPEWLVVFYGPAISPVTPPEPIPPSMGTVRWGDIGSPIVVGNFVNL